MKVFYILALLLAISLTGICQEEIDITVDSIQAKETYSVVPFIDEQNVQKSSVVVYQVNDPSVLQFSNGQLIFSGLTGQVPNMGMHSGAYSLRLGTPLLVIDGMNFSAHWADYANFNTVDFEKITIVNNSNLSSLTGGAAAHGAVVLQSKTGENVTKPTFSFNQNVNYAWNNGTNYLGNEYDHEWWFFTSNVSYGQDFGKIDTRVSYNWSYGPDDGLGSNAHTFRINTGFEITPKLSARLILDDNFYSKEEQGYRQYQNLKRNRNNNAFNGNLFLNYSILDWLSISSQLGVSDLDINTESATINQKEDNNRKFGNLYVTANKKFKTFDARFFVGGRIEGFKTYRETSSQGSYLNDKTKINQHFISTGINTSYKSFLTTNFTMGWEKSSAFPDDQKPFTNFDIGTSFVFTELIKLNQFVLSFGKVRANFSRGIHVAGYPDQNNLSSISSFIDNGVNKSFEMGVDLSSLKGKLGFSYTFFSSKIDELAQSPFPNTSGYVVYYHHFNYELTGNEMVLWANVLNNSKIYFRTGLIWSNLNSKLKSESEPLSGGTLGSPTPDWTTFWTNHLTWKSITFRTIMGINYGGIAFSSYPPQAVNKTNFNIAEWSLGYSFKKLLKRNIVEDMNLSVVGRNLFVEYYKTDMEIQNDPSVPPKNVSFNFGITF